MTLRFPRAAALCLMMLPAACMMPQDKGAPEGVLPVMRWDHRPEAAEWTQATLHALKDEGAVLSSTVPMDVAAFCPNYATATPHERNSFWAGLFSAIAKYESTWNPAASGGGGRYLGLLQISPQTARSAGCDLSQGGLKDGASNLECAVRIASRRADQGEPVAQITADWGPMHSAEKRAEMAAWTRKQSYCQQG